MDDPWMNGLMDAWMDESANCQLHLHDRAMYTDANIHRNHVLACLPFARLVKEGYKRDTGPFAGSLYEKSHHPLMHPTMCREPRIHSASFSKFEM